MEPTLIELYRQSPGPEWFTSYRPSGLLELLEESDIDALLSEKGEAPHSYFWTEMSLQSPMDLVARRPDYPWINGLLMRRSDLTPEVFTRLNISVKEASVDIHLEFPPRMPDLGWTINLKTREHQVTLELIERYQNTPALANLSEGLIRLYRNYHADPALNVLLANKHHRLLHWYKPTKKHMDLVWAQIETICREAPTVFSQNKLTKYVMQRNPEILTQFPHDCWDPVYLVRGSPRGMVELLDLCPVYAQWDIVCQRAPLEYIMAHPVLGWDWRAISRRADLRLSLVRDHPELPWEKSVISCPEAILARSKYIEE